MLPCKPSWNDGVAAVGSAGNVPASTPQPYVGSPRGFRDWLAILQVVSATLTLPGGTAIVLSIWLASRWARTADQERVDAQQRANAAQQEAKKWQDEAVAARASADSAESRISALETQIATLDTQIATLQAAAEQRPRPRRRQLRH